MFREKEGLVTWRSREEDFDLTRFAHFTRNGTSLTQFNIDAPALPLFLLRVENGWLSGARSCEPLTKLG